MKHIKTFVSFVGSIHEGDLFKQTLTPQQRFAETISGIQKKVQELKAKANDKPEESIYINAQIEVEHQKLYVIKAQMQAERIKTQMASRKEQEKRMKEYENKNKKTPPKSKD